MTKISKILQKTHIYKNISEHKPTKSGTSSNRHAVQITIVGDGACGKTWIMHSWANDGQLPVKTYYPVK